MRSASSSCTIAGAPGRPICLDAPPRPRLGPPTRSVVIQAARRATARRPCSPMRTRSARVVEADENVPSAAAGHETSASPRSTPLDAVLPPTTHECVFAPGALDVGARLAGANDGLGASARWSASTATHRGVRAGARSSLTAGDPVTSGSPSELPLRGVGRSLGRFLARRRRPPAAPSALDGAAPFDPGLLHVLRGDRGPLLRRPRPARSADRCVPAARIGRSRAQAGLPGPGTVRVFLARRAPRRVLLKEVDAPLAPAGRSAPGGPARRTARPPLVDFARGRIGPAPGPSPTDGSQPIAVVDVAGKVSGCPARRRAAAEALGH